MTHLAATTEPKEFQKILRAIDTYHASATVSAALRLAPLFFVRPGELRHARWADMDLEEAEWRFISPKTKKAHLVPLCTQFVAILTELKPFTYSADGPEPQFVLSGGTHSEEAHERERYPGRAAEPGDPEGNDV